MKTASKFLSMLLLVAMCLSLMGGSAYALAPLGDAGSSDGLASVPSGDGLYGLAPVEDGSNTVSGGNTVSGDNSVNSGTSAGDEIFGLFETDSDVELNSAVDYNWIVGANVYKTLGEALGAVNNGGTISVNASVSLNESVTINKNVTIDLKGNTLTLNGNQLYVASGSTLNLQNGTVINSDKAIANVDGYLNLYDLTASSATFTGSATSSSNPCRIQIYGGCNFSGSVPDDKYMAPGFGSDGGGNTQVNEARIGNVYYKTAKEALQAAKAGETVTLITNTGVAADYDATGLNLNNSITVEMGGNCLNMEGTSINNANITFNGTQIKGTVTGNNANITLGSGTDASSTFYLNGGSLSINGGDVGSIVPNGATVSMGSGTIQKIHVTGNSTLNVSGGTVEEFVTDANVGMTRAITGGQWRVADGHKLAFESAIANGYEAVAGNTYYTVRKIGDSGSGGNDGDFNYVVYGSPYTRNSNGSVYVDFSHQSSNGYWVGTNSNATNATKLPTNYYSVVNNVYNLYNYRLTFNNSYLNSLANGTYYIFAVYNGNTVRMGSFTVQGDDTPIIPGDAAVWPANDSTWYSGDGMFYFYVQPNLKLVTGGQYSYYDVVIDGMQIGGDKLSYNGYQKFGIASSVMDTLSTGNHTITVLTTNGYATGSFKVGATLRPVDTDKHVIGSSKNLQFVCSEPISRVWVGGVEITNNWGDYYTLSSSGKTITLNAAFLNNRTAGQTYTLTVQTTYGDQPSCTFQILTKAQASGSPKTGDESNLAMWAAVLLLSGGATVAVLPRLKKSKGQ